MYIRTKFAWYILDTPATLYRQLFAPFWTQHRMLHLLVTTALTRPRITYEDFIDSLRVRSYTDANVAAAASVIGRELTQEDVESAEVVCHVPPVFTHSHYSGPADRMPTSSARFPSCASKRAYASAVYLLYDISLAQTAAALTSTIIAPQPGPDPDLDRRQNPPLDSHPILLVTGKRIFLNTVPGP